MAELRDRFELPWSQLVQTGQSPDPDVSIAILVDRADRVVRQSRLDRQVVVRDRTVVDPDPLQAMTEGGDPQVPVAILVHPIERDVRARGEAADEPRCRCHRVW
jgi:hypothetical protein